MGLYSIPFSELNCKQLKTKLIPLNSLALVKGPVFGMSSVPLSIAFWAGVNSAAQQVLRFEWMEQEVAWCERSSAVFLCILINCLILHLFYWNTSTIERQELAFFFCLVFTWTDLAYKRTKRYNFYQWPFFFKKKKRKILRDKH